MTPDIQELKRLAEAAKKITLHSPDDRALYDFDRAASPETILALIEVVEAAEDMWRLTLVIESYIRQMEGVDSDNYKSARAAIVRLRTALEGVKP